MCCPDLHSIISKYVSASAGGVSSSKGGRRVLSAWAERRPNLADCHQEAYALRAAVIDQQDDDIGVLGTAENLYMRRESGFHSLVTEYGPQDLGPLPILAKRLFQPGFMPAARPESATAPDRGLPDVHPHYYGSCCRNAAGSG